MFYVGDWHSHHSLGLSEPSGPDDAKLQDLASKNGWPRLFSLIIETVGAGSHNDYHVGRRDKISQRQSGKAGSRGPIEACGVWWNAFQYFFTAARPVRDRVAVEFQSGRNPHDAISEEINAGLERGTHPRSYEVGGVATSETRGSEVHSRTETSARGDELVISTYQKVCGVLSTQLPRAHMEVDLGRPSGASLVVYDAGKEVVCSICGTADGSLAVAVNSAGGEQIVFDVPYPRGRVDPVAVRTIVARILEQFSLAT